MTAHEAFVRARGRAQTWWFVWRVRVRARLAGGRARLFVRRTNPFDLSPRRRAPLRRIERGVRLEIPRGAAVRLYLGDRVSVAAGTTLRLGAPVYLGDGCTLAPGARVDADNAVVLRERSALGANSAVLARGGDVEVHPRAVLEPNAAALGGNGAPTSVGRGARVAAGATILPGADVAPGAETGPAEVVRPGPRRSVSAGRGRPAVSVVVSTKDRVDMLPRLFDALEAQTFPASRFELVIVDNGSGDRTLAWLRARARRTPFRTTVLRREPPGGPARGRNAGWRAARAPIVAFTDDDCAPAPEWLEEALAAFGRDDALGLVQGRTDPDPRQVADLRGLASSQRIEWERGLYETCNVFYRREALEAAGGFAEDIPVPAAEDTELAWKVKGMGWRTAFVRDAVVHHAVHPGGIRGYARRFAQWAEVHRTLRRTPAVRHAFFLGHFWTRWHLWFLLALAGGAAAAVLLAAGVPFGWAPLAACAPYAGFLLRNSRESLSVLERLAFAPVRVAADAIEVATLARGSVRHRALLL